MKKRGVLLRTTLALALIGAIVAFYLLDLGRFFDLHTLKAQQIQLVAWQEEHPYLLAALYILVYVVVTALSLPGAAVMTLAGGAIFGLWRGVLLVSFASSIGAALAMLVSRYLLRDWVQQRFGKRLQRIDAGIRRDGAFYLFGLRLVPIFPFFVINLLMGLTPIRLGTYYGVSQLGMLPATFVYVNAGTQLARIDSLSGLLSPRLIGAFALLALLPWISRWALERLRVGRLYRAWPRPRRFDRNLVVIGAGSAGLVSAYIAATVRARVTLVEAQHMGGDCLNTGCVPSKALIRVAHAAHEARSASRFGIEGCEPQVDFRKVMQQVHAAVQSVAPHDSVERYRALGVDVRRGHARIVSPWCVEVDGEPITTRAIIIAAGAEPSVPPLPGLAECGYLTSDTLWQLDELPARLVILGGGPIGCEMAQAFARLGSKVTQVQRADRLLRREDDEVSDFVRKRLEAEGVNVLTAHKAIAVEHDDACTVLVCEHEGNMLRLPFDRILVAVGRRPRTTGYGLDDLGISLDTDKTIESNDFLQTRFPNILVCGDVAGPFQFTHAGAHQAWYAAVNALFAPLKTFRADYRVIPAVTFTDPEVARVGLTECEARQQGLDIEVTCYDLAELDRALAEHEAHGFVKILTARGKDRILGATCVGRHAGEWMAELALAMKHNIGLNKILGTVHAYPTWAEANKYAAGQWKQAHKPERILAWLERWHRWKRR